MNDLESLRLLQHITLVQLLFLEHADSFLAIGVLESGSERRQCPITEVTCSFGAVSESRT